MAQNETNCDTPTFRDAKTAKQFINAFQSSTSNDNTHAIIQTYNRLIEQRISLNLLLKKTFADFSSINHKINAHIPIMLSEMHIIPCRCPICHVDAIVTLENGFYCYACNKIWILVTKVCKCSRKMKKHTCGAIFGEVAVHCFSCGKDTTTLFPQGELQ